MEDNQVEFANANSWVNWWERSGHVVYCLDDYGQLSETAAKEWEGIQRAVKSANSIIRRFVLIDSDDLEINELITREGIASEAEKLLANDLLYWRVKAADNGLPCLECLERIAYYSTNERVKRMATAC
jgi:hypothetical protein